MEHHRLKNMDAAHASVTEGLSLLYVHVVKPQTIAKM